MIAIKTADITQDFKKYADKVMRGEKVLIARPKNENLVILTETEYNSLEKTREKTLARCRKNTKAIREQSILNGTDQMNMDEINAILEE